MIYKRLGLGLGLFSIALGLGELLAAKRVTKALRAEGGEGLVKAFGARELLAGAALVAAPAVSTGVWARVAGDALDVLGVGAALRRDPKNGWGWGALGFVIAVTALDVIVARGLDRTTGRMLPHKTQKA